MYHAATTPSSRRLTLSPQTRRPEFVHRICTRVVRERQVVGYGLSFCFLLYSSQCAAHIQILVVSITASSSLVLEKSIPAISTKSTAGSPHRFAGSPIWIAFARKTWHVRRTEPHRSITMGS